MPLLELFLRDYFESKHVSTFLTDVALAEFLEEGWVIIWITENGDTSVILCSST